MRLQSRAGECQAQSDWRGGRRVLPDCDRSRICLRLPKLPCAPLARRWAALAAHGAPVISIKAYANEDDGLVVWQSDSLIPGCLGFAIERRLNGQVGRLRNYVGFPGQTGGPRPSTEWPFQRWKWTDHTVAANDRIAYRVTAMVGTPGVLAPGPRSPWSTEISALAGSPIGAHFNRGIVASQWVARRLGADTVANHPIDLLTAIATPGDALRDALSGDLRRALLGLLDRVADPKTNLYAALFELSDQELLEGLTHFGDRAHVVLANGAYRVPHAPSIDENAAARERLRTARVDVRDRLVRSGLAHNKFLVLTESGQPTMVWTGSTNWQPTGLCTQANNALVIEDSATAGAFLAQWERLAAAGGRYPHELRLANAEPKRFTLATDRKVSVWFTPLAGRLDLSEAQRHIDAAEHAILFLMFIPGPRDTLLNAINAKVGQHGPNGQPLYVRGVVNQDPGGRKQPVFLYDERGIVPKGVEIVLPAAIDDPFARWSRELRKAPRAHAMVHSKCVVIDPFGAHPVVMTGSHNLGPGASAHNDDNLVIVEGDRALATAYTVNILGIYGNYRWRENHLRAHPGRFTDLQPDDSWQRWGLHGDGLAERQFWFG